MDHPRICLANSGDDALVFVSITVVIARIRETNSRAIHFGGGVKSSEGCWVMVDGHVLSKPARNLLASYAEALQAGFEGWPVGDVIRKDDALVQIETDPDGFIEMISNFMPDFVTLPDGAKVSSVPNEALWLSKGNEFLGAFNLRLELSPNLKLVGGHVGYEIRESHRGQGLATIGLALVKKRAWEKHRLSELLITCSPENVASERVIIKNGGIYQDTLENPHGFGPIKRFWIRLG